MNLSITAIVNGIAAIILILFQLKIINENLPQEYVIDIVLAIVFFTLSKELLDKRRSKAHLNCPECTNAKMHTVGEWKCEKCKKVFDFDEC